MYEIPNFHTVFGGKLRFELDMCLFPYDLIHLRVSTHSLLEYYSDFVVSAFLEIGSVTKNGSHSD